MLFGSKIVIILKEFDDHREAEDAIYEMNGKELMGGRWGSWYNSTNFQRKKTLVENKTNKKKTNLIIWFTNFFLHAYYCTSW